MTQLFFGIGMPKSGSNSLAAALQMLGIETFHSNGGTAEKGQNAVFLQLLENKRLFRPLVEDITGVEAFVDWPIYGMWRQLGQDYPAAKFILTYRDPYASALSWCRMLHAQPKIAEKQDVREYRRFADNCVYHVDAVLTAFLCQTDRLLILDAHDSDDLKWKLLATFVGKQPPASGTPYPHEFNHAKWQADKQMAEDMRNRAMDAHE